MQKAAIRVCVDVSPPTAHEKAEAFLTLVEWLENTLHNPEKRVLAGLPPGTHLSTEAA